MQKKGAAITFSDDSPCPHLERRAEIISRSRDYDQLLKIKNIVDRRFALAEYDSLEFHCWNLFLFEIEAEQSKRNAGAIKTPLEIRRRQGPSNS